MFLNITLIINLQLFPVIFQMEFPEYRYAENNMLKKGPDDEYLVDLDDLFLGKDTS